MMSSALPAQKPSDKGEIGAAAAAAAAAAGPAWRQFSFFETSSVRDVNDFVKSPAALRSPNLVAAITPCPIRPSQSHLETLQDSLPDAGPSTQPAPRRSSSSQPSILVGTIDGKVKVLDPESYVEIASWDAFSTSSASGRVTHLSCDSRGRVITLGEEDSSRFPILRIWDLRTGRKHSEKASWMPRLLAETKVQHGSRPHPIAALAHTRSLSVLSVALGDGTVLLIRALDTALMSANSSGSSSQTSTVDRPIPAVSLPKFKVVHQPSSADGTSHEPVTALGFSQLAPPPSTALSPPVHPTHNAAKAIRGSHPSRTRKGMTAAPRQRVGVNKASADSAIAAEANKTMDDTAPTSVHLFIVTLSRILRYVVVGKGAGASPSILDDVGSALGCAAIIPSRKQGSLSSSLSSKMVIAREEAIYVVGPEGREACFAYEGPKSSIQLSGSQVVIVSPPFAASAASASATVRNFVNSRDTIPSAFTPSSSVTRGSPLSNVPLGRKTLQSEVAKVTVFDLDNKLVAFSGTFERGVREAWVGQSGEVFVLSDNGDLTRLDEKPLRAKLDILYRKSLYLLAVNLARSHSDRAETADAAASIETLMADVYQRYGDHLYAKADYEGAMAQYIKTIGYTQPSFVIRKFLDAQRITNLTTYLQELHSRGMASSDHTTLLLNCYTKLKDVASLDKFIKRPHAHLHSDRPSSPDLDHADGLADPAERDELPFDLETAIRVCRQAGYYSHAAYLAKRYGEHDEYLRIQIEDANDFQDALDYVGSLQPQEAIRNMGQYGKVLLDQLPEKVTDFLIELCSGTFRPITDAERLANAAVKESEGKSAAAAYLSYLQVGAFGKNSNTTQTNGAGGAGTGSSTPNEFNASPRNSTATTEPYMIEGGSKRQATGPGGDELSESKEKVENYSPPSPRSFFAHFIQHPIQFIRFLETVAQERWGQSVDMDLHAATHDPLSLDAAPLARGASVEANDEVERALQELGLSSLDTYEDHDLMDQKSIWNTLLELYLTSSKPVQEGETNGFDLDRAERSLQREKALHLLEQHPTLPYDMSHALMLCSIEGFTEGLVLLYERMGMYEDILRFWMDTSMDELNDTSTGLIKLENQVVTAQNSSSNSSSSCKVMAALRKYGPANPQLYPMVLRYLVSSDAILSRHHNDWVEVLNHIDGHGMMSPLEVVQALSKTSVASVGLVREYLTRSILGERHEIEADQVEIENYRLETGKKLEEIAELTDTAQPRVFQMTRCTACGGQLNLPSVHFMCKHSYHQRCLSDNETECPSCAQSHGVIRDIRRNQEVFAERHDLFLSEIQESRDGFTAIANMYSKGLMGLASSAQM